MTNRIDFKDLVPDHIDYVEMPNGNYWYRDSMVCNCGDDSGLRYEDIYRDDEVHCDGCGALLRDFGGEPNDNMVPNPLRPADTQ